MPKTANRLQSGLALPSSASTGFKPLTKLLLVMKLTIILLTTMLTCTAATGLSQTVTFTGKDVSLKQVFKAIEHQTGFVVFSNRDLLSDANPVTVSAENMPLASFLQAVLKEQPFEFLIEGKTIVLSPKKISPPLIQLFAQQGRELSGIVYDDKTNSPLRGVSVAVNGTNKATQTDERGIFILKGLEGDITLTFTSIGYEKKVLAVSKNMPSVTVSLKVATDELDRAVVQAYGITSKRLSTGSITKVTGDEIRQKPGMNPMSALQGRVPGMQVTHLSGQSSAPLKMVIRGRNSINPNMLSEPLYVIDGIPQTVMEAGNITYNGGASSGFAQAGITFTKGQSPFFSINPKDIESIEVLKDADATAIYGSRGANGVILITTKKSQAGRTAFEVSLQQGVVTVPRTPTMMSLRDYLDMRNEAFKNDGITPTTENAPDLTLWDTTRSTNWIKELLGTGRNTDASVSLSGGDNRTSFRIGAGFTDQKDLNNRSGGNKRGTLHTNLRHSSLNQKFSVNLMASYSSSKVDVIDDATDGYTIPPNAPPIFNEKGDLNYSAWGDNLYSNQYPFKYILTPNIIKTNLLNSSLSLSYSLLKGLNLSGTMSYSKMRNTVELYRPIASYNPQESNITAGATLGSTDNTNLDFRPQLDYSRSIGKGRLTVMVNATMQKVSTATQTTTAAYIPTDDLIKNIGSALMSVTQNNYFDYKYASISGRINYNWDQKYILNLTGRRDGSSRFAPGTQYGNFGSVGAAWIVTEESWMKNVLPDWFSFIKLRSSYGTTGTDNIGNFAYLPRYSNTQPGDWMPMYTYNGVQPFVSITPVNQRYRWGAQHAWDLGLNLGFLDNKINVEITTYGKGSSNQLTELPTPFYTGFDRVAANWGAVVRNKGIEASVNANIIKKKDLQLNVWANISRNVNKLVSYPGIEQSPYATTYKVGQSLSTVYILHLTGVNPLTGDYSFEDYNKDGLITSYSNTFPGTGINDRYLAYDLNPKYFGGFGSDLTWKNYRLALAFGFSNQIGYPPYVGLSAGRMNNLVMPTDMMQNHWRKPGDNAKYPKFSTISDNRGSGFVNTSFLRLNSVNFSYSMPEKLTRRAGLQSCLFSLSVSNLFVITSYDMDPEIQSGSFNPIPRVIVGTLSFTL